MRVTAEYLRFAKRIYEEFKAVQATSSRGKRLVDGRIVRGGEKRIASRHEQIPSLTFM